MDVVIVGAGGVGFHIAKKLSEEKKDVAIIEKDLEKAQFASEHLDCLVINGEATDIDVLKQAGIDQASMFIAVTNSDEVNMISCFIAADRFNVEKKIVRLRKIQYMQKELFTFKKLGIDFVINPEVEATKAIVNSLNIGASADVILFGTDIQIRGIYIDADSPFKNKSIMDIKNSIDDNFIVSGISKSNGDFVIPDGYTTVEEGDYIYITAKEKTLDNIIEKSGKSKIRIRDIAIFGGGDIALMTARALIGKKRNVKVIEKDYERCKYISSVLKKATVINGNADDAELFEEENIADFDVVITATDNEEMNLLSGVYAKNIGAKRSIAIIDKSNYIMMASKLNIDVVISPKMTTVNSILKFIRKGNIVSVYSIFSGEAEAIEFIVSSRSPLKNKKIKNINLPKGSLIVAVNRDKETYIPDGNFELKQNDRVVLFIKKQHIEEIEKFTQDEI